MSLEENKAIVKNWEDAIFTCDAATIRKAAKEVFAPQIAHEWETRTAEKQGEHWAGLMADKDTNDLKRNLKVVCRIAEDDYVVTYYSWVFRYKDRTWPFNANRLILYKVQNGKVVEYQAANNRLNLQRMIDEGKIT